MSSRLDRAADDATRDKILGAERELAELNAKYGEIAADATLAGASMLPPPAGTIADVVSLGKSLISGDWGGALLDTVGFVPLFGDSIKAAGKGTKLLKLAEALEVGIKAAKSKLSRLKGGLVAARRAHAAKYWDEIVHAGRKRYDEAIASCSTQACRDAVPVSLKGDHYKLTPADPKKGDWVGGARGDGVWKPKPGNRLSRELENFSSNPKLNPSGKPVEGITYRNGFPEYDDLVVPAVPARKGQPLRKAQVEIPQTGNNGIDFPAADSELLEATGKTKAMLEDELGTKLTWHHKEDGVTMQLVPEKVHGARSGSGHSGGSSLVQTPEY